MSDFDAQGRHGRGRDTHGNDGERLLPLPPAASPGAVPTPSPLADGDGAADNDAATGTGCARPRAKRRSGYGTAPMSQSCSLVLWCQLATS